jgi:hypothetical protein
MKKMPFLTQTAPQLSLFGHGLLRLPDEKGLPTM